MNAFKEVIMAIAPMIVIILALMVVVIGFSKDTDVNFAGLLVKFLFGSVLVIVGMALFLFGAEYSMLRVGDLAGSYLMKNGKLVMALAAAFVIGTAITLAEPDVRVLSTQVSSISGGAVPSWLLLLFVGIGVGLFIVAGLAIIIFQKNLMLALLAGYIVTFAVAVFFTPSTFVPVSFDAGGVTTGPITVPFIMAFAAGATGVIGNKKGGESFGMVGIASLGPILACLILGVLFK
jgi:hypothetical protein